MYQRNDGKGEDNIIQNRFTSYLVSAVSRRKSDFLRTRHRRSNTELPTDPDSMAAPENADIDDPETLLCIMENAVLSDVLSSVSERDRYIFFSRALYQRSFDELAIELGLGYQGVAAAYHRVCKKVRNATGREVK